jgi:hypothetical protein
MDKLKVLVGLVYTQLMFCDKQGKLQFHRVMTDTDRPWTSIKEVLRMVKQALCMDKPIGSNCLIQSVQIDIQYWGMNFASILQTLRKKMEQYLPEECELSIQTIKDYREIVEERAREKVEDWEASLWEFSPLEVMDHIEQPDVIQEIWVQKEWYEPLIYTEYGLPLLRYERYEPFKGRIMSYEMPFDDPLPTSSIDGIRSNWKKENDLRGSPNESHSYIWSEGRRGACFKT